MAGLLYPFFSTTPIFGSLFILLVIWTIVWKGYALWKAGRNNQPYWFVALLVLNTAGILPIIYILFFRKNLNPNMTRHPKIVKKSLNKKIVTKKTTSKRKTRKK
jgi:hypothetical protein|tara:strand:+ start:152 stop:463 length:312 start_codon:yes stop_codon:yes gene_type:complete